jgi:cholesterol transport system auxiliary component
MFFIHHSLARSGNTLLRAAKYNLVFITIACLQACVTSSPAASLNYDFGPLSKEDSTNNAQAKKIIISIADISAPGTLDSNAMLYRLEYDNAQLLRPYAQHFWSMPPAQLLTQRIKSRIASAGGTVIGVADGVADLAILRIELDEFSQTFTSATHSDAKMAMRVSFIKKNKLLAQQYFALATPSISPDANGGAKAMQITADQSISAILHWLQTLPAY